MTHEAIAATCSPMPWPVRFWSWFGYGYRRAPDMSDLEDVEGFAPAYLEVEITVLMDWRDRLRALVSGKIAVVTRVKTDQPIKQHVTRCQFSVLRPGKLGEMTEAGFRRLKR